jgi:uncharacterized protein (TIGR03000 family)
MFRNAFLSAGGLFLSAAILLGTAAPTEAARFGGFRGGAVGFRGGFGGFRGGFGGYRGLAWRAYGPQLYAANRLNYKLDRALYGSYYRAYGYGPYGLYGYPYYGYPYYGYPVYDYSLYGAPGYSNEFASWYSPTASSAGQGYGAEESTASDTVAHLSVTVPSSAEIWFDGAATTSAGTVRDFTTPPLQPGQQYSYEVRARWQENGHDVTQSKKVTVSAGAYVQIAFPLPSRRLDVRRDFWLDPVPDLPGSEVEK